MNQTAGDRRNQPPIECSALRLFLPQATATGRPAPQRAMPFAVTFGATSSGDVTASNAHVALTDRQEWRSATPLGDLTPRHARVKEGRPSDPSEALQAPDRAVWPTSSIRCDKAVACLTSGQIRHKLRQDITLQRGHEKPIEEPRRDVFKLGKGTAMDLL